MDDKANVLETQPITSTAPIGKSEVGNDVLFHVKHLHGLHGTVVAVEDGQYIVRGTSDGIEGQLFQFGPEALVPGNTLLKWDYKD